MTEPVVYRPENWSRSPIEDPEAQLVGGRCSACGQTWYPQGEICQGCLARNAIVPLPLSRTGTLYSYSVLHYGPAAFDPPYAIAYVDLPEGVRVFGHLDGWKEGPRALGETLRIYGGVIGRAPNGSPLIGIRFAPAPSAKNPGRKEQNHARVA